MRQRAGKRNADTRYAFAFGARSLSFALRGLKGVLVLSTPVSGGGAVFVERVVLELAQAINTQFYSRPQNALGLGTLAFSRASWSRLLAAVSTAKLSSWRRERLAQSTLHA